MTEQPADRTRVWIGLFVAGAAILVAAASFVAVVWTGLGTCGGDGGYPYSARDSTAGRACEVIDEHE